MLMTISGRISCLWHLEIGSASFPSSPSSSSYYYSSTSSSAALSTFRFVTPMFVGYARAGQEKCLDSLYASHATCKKTIESAVSLLMKIFSDFLKTFTELRKKKTFNELQIVVCRHILYELCQFNVLSILILARTLYFID